jgi:hypothetical protein
MLRISEIILKSIDYGKKTHSDYDDGKYDLYDLEQAFEEGAKWADDNPSPKSLAKELHRLGYTITLNGDIIPRAEEEEAIKRYIEYQKSQFIKKACEWLEKHVRDYKYYDSDLADGNIDVDDLIYGFKKAMEK